MSKLSSITRYLEKNVLTKVERTYKKLKRKTKRKLSDFKDILSLNFHNVNRHKRALRRYKRYSHIHATKKNKKDKLSITQAYSTFSYTIIILVITWTILNAFSIYKNLSESFKERTEVQKKIIEQSFSTSISLIDNFSSYVGDKILLFGVNDKRATATILKKNNTSDLIVRNFYSWLDVDYVDSKSNIVVTSRDGVLDKEIPVPDYYPIAEAQKQKWRFKMGGVTEIDSPYGEYNIIPVAFAIDDDDYTPRGTLISRIIIDKVRDDIRRGTEDEDVSYMVISRDFDFIAYSENDIILHDEKKKRLIKQKLHQNKELQRIFESFNSYIGINKDGLLKTPINIGNTSYKSYRKSDYPFIVLTSYSKKAIWKEFQEKLESVLFQSIAITLLFLSALFLFKRIQIVPIIKQLVNSREKAEEANKAKSSFLSTISHELRTPMNGIIGMSQILAESKNLDDEEWDQVKTIHRSANALLLILNDILNFSKIEAQKVELEKIDFNLHLLMENTIDIMSPTAMKKGLEIFLSIDQKIPKILIGDPGRIRQIITNLVNNAIKFTAKGQILVEITLEKELKNKNLIRFNVKDSGIGIKKSDLKNMFKKFTQADMSTTRKYGGTGLGLSICKELVKLMGGHIGIESGLGKGSNFWFSIKLPKSEENIEPLKQRQKEQISNKEIALIETNKIGRRIFKENITNLFDATTNVVSFPDKQNYSDEDLDRIVQKLENTECSCIFISNCKVKNFEATKLIQKIKQSKTKSQLPIILSISAYEKGKLKDEDIKNLSYVITKPAKETSIIEAVLQSYKVSYKKDRRLEGKESKQEESTPYKILMCEDNKINMKVALAVLNRMGYDIDIAENGKEGYDKIFVENKRYDLIFMDCMMPIMDGFTATQKIREQEKEEGIQKTPIIALTANISQNDQDRCFESGMDGFLSKPIKKDQVEKIINKWAERK